MFLESVRLFEHLDHINVYWTTEGGWGEGQLINKSNNYSLIIGEYVNCKLGYNIELSLTEQFYPL